MKETCYVVVAMIPISKADPTPWLVPGVQRHTYIGYRNFSYWLQSFNRTTQSAALPWSEQTNHSNINPDQDRDFANGDNEFLGELINELVWSVVLEAADVDRTVNEFNYTIYAVFDIYSPKKTTSFKTSNQNNYVISN